MSQSYVCSRYRLVFSIKNRVPAIPPEIEPRLWESLAGTVRGPGGTPIRIGGIEDRVHLLVTLRQEPALSVVLRDIKAASSGRVHDTFPEAKGFWWQGGYGAFTVSHSTTDAVKAYSANQKAHHEKLKMSFPDELRKSVEKHGVAFKEEYLRTADCRPSGQRREGFFALKNRGSYMGGQMK